IRHVAVAALAVFPFALPVFTAGQTVQERLGYPAGAKLLVIHADDLGMSHSVNRATFEALEHGWVTSSSILVPCPWFPDVAGWARAHPNADLGIHLAVNSEWTSFRWGPVSGRDAVPSLLDKDGYLPLLEDEVVKHARPAEVEHELRAQIDMAKAAGIPLTHLDSHMATLFQTQALFDVYRKLGAAYGLPNLLERLGARGGAASSLQVQSDALIDRIVSVEPGVTPAGWLDAYRTLLTPLGPGVYQLIVHLGYDDDEMRGATSDHPNWGARWRQSDFDMVKSQAFRDFLRERGFTLIGWRDLGKARKPER
ncbi:MAG TPA: polysaccharide deacetylase family protein, partial [Vicinamibacterales bacterium]|nr:polysaccharide deacetylase family protein [Vicinamibacterales bacterium]